MADTTPHTISFEPYELGHPKNFIITEHDEAVTYGYSKWPGVLIDETRFDLIEKYNQVMNFQYSDPPKVINVPV